MCPLIDDCLFIVNGCWGGGGIGPFRMFKAWWRDKLVLSTGSQDFGHWQLRRFMSKSIATTGSETVQLVKWTRGQMTFYNIYLHFDGVFVLYIHMAKQEVLRVSSSFKLKVGDMNYRKKKTTWKEDGVFPPQLFRKEITPEMWRQINGGKAS